MTSVRDDGPLPFRNHGRSGSADARVPGSSGDRRRQGAREDRASTVGPWFEQPLPRWMSMPRLPSGPRRGRTGVPSPLVVLIVIWLVGLTLEAILF